MSLDKFGRTVTGGGTESADTEEATQFLSVMHNGLIGLSTEMREVKRISTDAKDNFHILNTELNDLKRQVDIAKREFNKNTYNIITELSRKIDQDTITKSDFYQFKRNDFNGLKDELDVTKKEFKKLSDAITSELSQKIGKIEHDLQKNSDLTKNVERDLSLAMEAQHNSLKTEILQKCDETIKNKLKSFEQVSESVLKHIVNEDDDEMR